MNEWALLLIGVIVAWMAVKVIGMMLKVTLWLLLAGIAYFFFASVFGWPLP
ncbi:hypothetical protein [Solilutibacter pythonis]|uniref:hypothetical protein n=1 Tax=Solilutibacter pythonis TaxID=2483112 RepID=UPI0013148870|nr:hypothetical protein [Lysobacter pythonis]